VIVFYLKILEFGEDLIIVQVSLGQKDILLFIDSFINFDLFLFFLIYVNMNRYISQLILKLFSAIYFLPIFLIFPLIPCLNNIKLTFRLT
jgi:hypothetical protein